MLYEAPQHVRHLDEILIMWKSLIHKQFPYYAFN